MKCRAIILDLDDTIFQTKSMDANVFNDFFEHLSLNLSSQFNQVTIDAIINDLWSSAWDFVISKYNIPKEIIISSIDVLDNLDLKLTISTYPDYQFIKELSITKFLVTTSLTSLQKAKIRALNIENDFEKIVINDTFIQAKTKLDIFKELMDEYNLIPEKTIVIGDNSASEIAAGNKLNMITIQILRNGVTRGNNAKHFIHSFEELSSLINI
ncbi:MAG: HAD hydrolase-like protein [Bacteroidetes bacterium]|nr:HAD hydrolase-like protein [Bacteroidota bacterium]